MALLILFTVAFGLVHLIPAMPAVKAGLANGLGKAYGPVYGIATLALLVGVFWAFRNAPATVLYDPPAWGRHANFALSLIGFLFIGIFLFRGSWRNAVKYPMAIGASLWALGHLLANGDDRTTVLFIGIAGFGLLYALLKARSGHFTPSEVRDGHNLMSLLAGLALYGLAAQLHMVIAGVPLVTLQ